MTYNATEARVELLAAIASAIDAIAEALAALGEAYELLDEASADRLEEQLFGPVQAAYGRARRTHAEFSARAGVAPTAFTLATPGHPSQGTAGFVASALESVAAADGALAGLQDSMVLVDVGDAELRSGISAVRQQLGEIPARGRMFQRTLGR